MYYRIILGSFITVSAYLLVTGHSILVNGMPLIPEYQAGNLITWVALIAISLLGLSFVDNASKFRYPLWVSVFMAVMWVPGSFMITGNFNNEFSTGTVITFETWMYLSSLSVILTLTTLIFYYLNKVWNRIREKCFLFITLVLVRARLPAKADLAPGALIKIVCGHFAVKARNLKAWY